MYCFIQKYVDPVHIFCPFINSFDHSLLNILMKAKYVKQNISPYPSLPKWTSSLASSIYNALHMHAWVLGLLFLQESTIKLNFLMTKVTLFCCKEGGKIFSAVEIFNYHLEYLTLQSELILLSLLDASDPFIIFFLKGQWSKIRFHLDFHRML